MNEERMLNLAVMGKQIDFIQREVARLHQKLDIIVNYFAVKMEIQIDNMTNEEIIRIVKGGILEKESEEETV